ncbi:MAG: S1 family peptidase [Bacteriovorax sp.]
MEIMKKTKKRKSNALFLGAWVLFSLALASCGANKGAPHESESQISDIVNGKSVTSKNEMAHSVVAIVTDKNDGQALCTGTIVAPDVVLTAAHCVDDGPQKLHLVFGLNVQKTKHENIREADRFYQHPNWNRHLPTGEGDLALIHFTGSLPTGYSPVKLADKNLTLKMGQKVLMIGYGVTDGESKSGAGKLRQTNSSIIERHSATEIISDGKKSSVCFGDSGGPAFIETNKTFIQWGVASSVTNSSCDDASIHTEVMKYLPWINSSIRKMQH